MADLVTFGEAMIRLSPPDHMRLEQASVLDVRVGGAELNVAMAAAQLGLTTAWVSRLVDNWAGRLIRNKGRELGVDMSHILWRPFDGAAYADGSWTLRKHELPPSAPSATRR